MVEDWLGERVAGEGMARGLVGVLASHGCAFREKGAGVGVVVMGGCHRWVAVLTAAVDASGGGW